MLLKIVSLGICIVLFYPLIIRLITNNDIYEKSITPFLILISGIIIACGYLPFYNLFLMSNLPWVQSIFMLSIVFTNILANLVFIPLYGINGAALGTVISLLTSIFLFKNLSKKKLELKYSFLKHITLLVLIQFKPDNFSHLNLYSFHIKIIFTFKTKFL